jgi:hypothetical protein
MKRMNFIYFVPPALLKFFIKIDKQPLTYATTKLQTLIPQVYDVINERPLSKLFCSETEPLKG